jgi:NADPH2:quinone reductase
MQNTMKAVRQAEAGGRLLIETVPLPEPGPGQVLVRMAASPINPSDLASIREPYMVSSWPFTPGLEGSGTVVRAGKGLLPALRKGKRVACSPDPGGDGTWAEYLLTSALRTVPLPAKVGFDQGSMLLVNPMTAMAFIHMARRGRHGAMVNNAGASSLGRMLIRLTTHYGIPLISIVRREDQVEALKTEGAVHVLNSSDPSFEADLRDVSGRLGATLVLDAVTGPETGRLLRRIHPGGSVRPDPAWQDHHRIPARTVAQLQTAPVQAPPQRTGQENDAGVPVCEDPQDLSAGRGGSGCAALPGKHVRGKDPPDPRLGALRFLC